MLQALSHITSYLGITTGSPPRSTQRESDNSNHQGANAGPAEVLMVMAVHAGREATAHRINGAVVSLGTPQINLSRYPT